ncbi:gtp-binding protein lepa [Conidiobolus coronatus NRRL 28638]|uniref:Gtp-binding protein lepa n=1 Tax=Conidiobolus coronatus (strain ATCC 28846 / CBS 209.66 / NRRL 28638) TaxID=796925 RepID=A0A137PFZ2_CONC2|nr:gtp-binding protein lepa [Conidiobolus coronatus NRRL 28638]|eukprot:KXN73890.1 gtp-binding protein lepa [Conidiobolus coronatus NRRL 28638]
MINKLLNRNLINLNKFNKDKIRNFSIIAHIDHGKSTLADRLLELTGAIAVRGAGNKQVLDKLKVEKERGITVKAQTASLFYTYKGEKYLLNLIDTPGHVDFSYEVSRSLSACQGTLLLVDAVQGVQAQTVANFYLAFGEGIKILPVINKIDLPGADVENVKNQLVSSLELEPEGACCISAKTGLNVNQLLDRIVEEIPPPSGDVNAPLKALLFDSWYDNYQGVICMVAVIDGQVKKGDKILSMQTGLKYEALDVGILHPNMKSVNVLQAGQVGYISMSMKNPKDAKIGDTFCLQRAIIKDPLPGFVQAKPMVFSGIFPINNSDFPKLEESITHLTLNDSSVSIQRETSMALGQGWRLGFLGTLHMDVFKQRLEQEYDANIIVTQPTVPYKVIYNNGVEKIIQSPQDFPEPHDISTKVSDLMEPIIKATLIFPLDYLGNVIELCQEHRCDDLSHSFIDNTRIILRCELPLAEIVSNFYDKLKSRTSGYASFDYEEAGYRSSDLVKMTVLINSVPVDVLTSIHHRSKINTLGRQIAAKLKDVIEKQLFEVVIQTAVNKKIIARETISAMRKNVTAKCYGGDITRKMKLLQKQKEGKKRMKMIGNVNIPHEAFLKVIDNN